MNLTQLTLNVRIPSIGAEFRTGVNCSAIELGEHGELVRIRDPKLEPSAGGYGCGFDLIITAFGWSKRAHAASDEQPNEAPVITVLPSAPQPTAAKHTCPRCSRGFLSTQALGSHLVRKHAPGKGQELK